MPRPVDARARYEPALDGIRAIAVLAVVGYHLEAPGFGGGLLGVGVFFTLSGFLITRILARTWRRHDTIPLRDFWVRRARRLLPALFALLVAVLVATLIVDRSAFGTRAGEAGWATVYLSNWATILSGRSYFDRFASLGPLDHLWSLAIEEQFYVVWPLALGGLLRVFGGAKARVAAVCLALAAGSFALLAILGGAGFDSTRAYEGTDTRAGGLLVGAALALLWHPKRSVTLERSATLALDIAGGVAFAVIVALVAFTDDTSASLYDWGLLTLTLATVVLVAVATHPGSNLARRALSTHALTWVGERSYGIYLWNLPVVALTPVRFLHQSGLLRGLVQLLLTGALAAASWHWIEDPVRRHGMGAFARRERSGGLGDAGARSPRRAWADRPALRPVAAVILSVLALTATHLVTPGASAATKEVSPEDAEKALERAGGAELDLPIGGSTTTTTAAPAVSTTTTTIPPGPRTRCEQVVHVGDSTSVGLVAPNVLEPEQRVDARYRDVGVRLPFTDIAGARSIIERYKNKPNAAEAVSKAMTDGYDGCWVFAMGTNDTANQAVGSKYDSADRVGRLMSQVGTDTPVMWLTVKSLRTTGPYAETEMQKWNLALLAACQQYPNMRVYDWASQVHDDWFQPDGIHFTKVGYAYRAILTARALAAAFPLNGPDVTGCTFVPPEDE